MNCEKSFVMLSAYFLRKIHSIMTNCKFVIGNAVKGNTAGMFTFVV